MFGFRKRLSVVRDMDVSPSPFIYWGQNRSTLFLRVALKDVRVRKQYTFYLCYVCGV